MTAELSIEKRAPTTIEIIKRAKLNEEIEELDAAILALE